LFVTPASRRSPRRKLSSLCLLLAAAIAASALASACSVTDLLSPGDGEDSAQQPTATATPTVAPTATPVPRQARGWPELRHRYIVTPPTADYDPGLIPVPAEEQYIADAIESWSRTSSVHFELEVDGTTYLDVNETIELDSVEGDLKRPDRARAEADVQIGFASFDVGLVVIGDAVYTTNFLTGDWERGPADFDFNPALIFNDERGVAAVLEALDDVAVGAESTIGGTRAVEITGTVDQEQISQLVAGSLAGAEISVSVWMDAKTGELIQIRLAEPEEVDGDPTAWVISFSDHNDPVTIEAPDL